MKPTVLGAAFGAAVVMSAGSTNACAVPAGFEPFVVEAVALTNAFRERQGRKALAASTPLAEAAQSHACYMAQTGNFSHKGATGDDVGDRARNAGFNWLYISENIAYGQDFASGAIGGWQGSPPHRENMLSLNARDIGIGLASNADGQLYWVMVLGQSY